MLEALKDRIHQLGVSEVAKRTSLSRSTINSFASGKAALTSDNLEKIMQALFFELKPSVPNITELISVVPCDPKKADQILKLAQILKSIYKPKKIILFGSQSRGDWEKDSDVDLLVVGFDQDVDGGEYYIAALEQGITIRFDVILASEHKIAEYKSEKSSIYYKALRDGVEIHV
jgi:predicted nucleotidyltransferase